MITGDVLEALARKPAEIELLWVRDTDGKLWEFATEGPIGIDAAHLLVHRDIGAGVEVVYLEKEGRLIALQVNDFGDLEVLANSWSGEIVGSKRRCGLPVANWQRIIG